MSASDNSNSSHHHQQHHHGSWYPSQEGGHTQQMMHPYYLPPGGGLHGVGSRGTAPPPQQINHHYSHHPHHQQQHPYSYAHHGGYYDSNHHHDQHHYPYGGSMGGGDEATLEDSTTTTTPAATLAAAEPGGSSNHRDSFRFYNHHHYPHHPQQQQQRHQAVAATPLQPPPHMYNGPPVSALVPRFPRHGAAAAGGQQQQPAAAASMMQHPQGGGSYTPNYHQHYEQYQDNNNRRISFPSSIPPSTTGGRSEVASNTSGSSNSRSGSVGPAKREDRRTSFGLPIISTNSSHFMIPTPLLCTTNGEKKQQHSAVAECGSGDNSPMSTIPPPPPACTGTEDEQQTKMTKNEDSGCSNADGLSESSTSPLNHPLQDSRRVNLLLSKKFDPQEKGDDNDRDNDCTTTTTTNEPPTKNRPPPTVQDASLLLGLRTDTSNANSPATVPEMQDEAADATSSTNTMNEPTISTSTTTEVPKTCFPAPVPKNYPKSLALPNNSIKLNALHCFIRTDLLEIFVVEPSNENIKFRHAPSSSVGRVGLRCVHCTRARRWIGNSNNSAGGYCNISSLTGRDDEAPMAVFYPKSVNEIYRLVTSWQRCHVRKCKSLPPSVRAIWNELRETEKSRGKTAYWADSAKQIGMVDCPSRAGGIRFDETILAAAAAEDGDGDFDMTNTENNEPTVVAAAAIDPPAVKVASTNEKSQTVVAMTSPLGSQANTNKSLAVYHGASHKNSNFEAV